MSALGLEIKKHGEIIAKIPIPEELAQAARGLAVKVLGMQMPEQNKFDELLRLSAGDHSPRLFQRQIEDLEDRFRANLEQSLSMRWAYIRNALEADIKAIVSIHILEKAGAAPELIRADNTGVYFGGSISSVDPKGYLSDEELGQLAEAWEVKIEGGRFVRFVSWDDLNYSGVSKNKKFHEPGKIDNGEFAKPPDFDKGSLARIKLLSGNEERRLSPEDAEGFLKTLEDRFDLATWGQVRRTLETADPEVLWGFFQSEKTGGEVKIIEQNEDGFWVGDCYRETPEVRRGFRYNNVENRNTCSEVIVRLDSKIVDILNIWGLQLMPGDLYKRLIGRNEDMDAEKESASVVETPDALSSNGIINIGRRSHVNGKPFIDQVRNGLDYWWAGFRCAKFIPWADPEMRK